MIESRIPHLILLDIVMPDMDGFELLEHVRSKKETERIPVIVITGDGKIETRDRSFALGAADFIEKPFMIEDLIPRVRRFVGAVFPKLCLESVNIGFMYDNLRSFL